MSDPIAQLQSLPRAGLVPAPTPLHPLDAYSGLVGADIWIKRDDWGSLALAGNKIRKFDLVLGEAVQRGCTTLVTTGAAQSNSARAGAAAAAMLGLDCVLLLAGGQRGEDSPAPPTGNLLLDDLLGADVRLLPGATWVELEAAVEAAAEHIRAEGGSPVTAPVGCSSPLGALGFALAFLELQEQCRSHGLRPGSIITTSSSLGTVAGLLVGAAITGDDTGIVGIDVGRIHPDLHSAAADLARRAAALIGYDGPIPAPDIRTGYLGAGYGEPTTESLAELRRLARSEAIITDPVYSAKGLHGMAHLASTGQIAGPVVFWHTGGYHALFDPAHAAALWA